MSRVKVAAVQFEPAMFDKDSNISRLLELCEQAAISGARLIVTPEMGTTGYCWFDRAEVAPFVCRASPGTDDKPLCGAYEAARLLHRGRHARS